jgi:hypothetical protein
MVCKKQSREGTIEDEKDFETIEFKITFSNSLILRELE